MAQSIFVMAPVVSNATTVAYFLDDQLASTETASPFWMGGQSAGAPYGLSLRSVAPGTHVLRAVATLSDGALSASSSITLNVVPSINTTFSSTLQPYANQLSAQETSVATLLADVATPGATLSSTETATRQQVATMYANWGINPALDYQNDQSTVLAGLAPTGWAALGTVPKNTPLSSTPAARTVIQNDQHPSRGNAGPVAPIWSGIR